MATTTLSSRAERLGKNLLDVLFIGSLLLVAVLVIGILRLWCWISPYGHDWETFSADTPFNPNLPDECRRCGKKRCSGHT